MLNELLRSIYACDIATVMIAVPVFLLAWSVVFAAFGERMKGLSAAVLLIGVTVIIYVTVFSRGGSEAGVDLIPCSSFFKAKENPQLYREMLMNVLLFFPFGLSFPFLISGGIKKRLLLTVLSGLVLSVTVEAIQLIFAIGLCETDDVLCNGAGTLLGGLSYPLSVWWMKHLQKRTDG